MQAIEGKHVFSKTGDEVVILGIETGKYYSLNPVGARFWAAIQRPVSIRAAAGAIVAEFEVAPETAEADLVELGEKLIAAGLAKTVGPA